MSDEEKKQPSEYDTFEFDNQRTQTVKTYPTDKPGMWGDLKEGYEVGVTQKARLDSLREIAQKKRDAQAASRKTGK